VNADRSTTVPSMTTSTVLPSPYTAGSLSQTQIESHCAVTGWGSPGGSQGVSQPSIVPACTVSSASSTASTVTRYSTPGTGSVA
jgi:hypothetical protein